LGCFLGEAEEETGLVLDPVSAKFVTANNNIMSDIDRHYVTVFISANVTGSTQAKVTTATLLWETRMAKDD
jgi:8-oxo-dGTP diphosphatase